jgi:hypothetical protein
MLSPRIPAACCLPLGIKDSLKEDAGFLMGKAFGLRVLGLLAFWCGRLLEGKRIAEGKLLKRGWVDRVCTKNFIHRL